MAISRRPQVFVEEERENGFLNDRRNVLAVFLLFSIITLAAFGWFSKKDRLSSEWVAQLERTSHLWGEAKELTDLNPTRARELAMLVQDQAKQLAKDGSRDEKLKMLQEELSRFLPAILGEYLVEGKIILDLSLVGRDFVPSSIAQNGKEIFALDSAKKTLVGFTFDGLELRTIEGLEDLPEASFAAVGERGRVLILDNQRIVEINPKEETSVPKTVALSDGKWGEIVFLGYFGESIYVTDQGNNELWRYFPLSGGSFGVPQPWFVDDGQKLRDGISFALDGFFWVLTEDGNLRKFGRGKEINFTIKNLDKPLSGPVFLYTNDELANIYILDPKLERVVVVDKEGNYRAQYNSEMLRGAKFFAVSEEKKKIIVFVGSRVYEINLSGDAGNCYTQETSSKCAQ